MKFEVTLADGKVKSFGSKDHVYTHALTIKAQDSTGAIVLAYMSQRCHSLVNAQKAQSACQKRMGVRSDGLRFTAEISEVRQVK